MKKEKYYVVSSDLLTTEEMNETDNTITLSMYCEIGGKNINPDTPPVFYMIIKYENGQWSLSIDNGDFFDGEEELYTPCIMEFFEEVKPTIDGLTPKLPILYQLDIDELFDITDSSVKPFWKK